ncbi:hypothetical protein [Paenibacillus sp. Leaf72]|uniref:hypothetical protein n=1 Tax=Paenibacillus sp. Leaf72 TaxID=1736234 RepID=UPI0006F87EAF|nr:hypothetical protein [Paenibacillus sp. Leaf72]KQO14749.1 hypothetical protein ASF12_29225 [Paenibacillus sp. Leaf72]
MALAVMSKQDFDTLNDERLGWACSKHILLQIRGKDRQAKNEAMAGLNESQRALCMFRVFYDHAKNSVSEYYGWVSQLLAEPGYWSGVTSGLQFFGDSSMLRLLEETKEIFEERRVRLGLQWSDAVLKDLEQDHDLMAAASRLFSHLNEIAPQSLRLIRTYIRANPQQFVRWENSEL